MHNYKISVCTTQSTFQVQMTEFQQSSNMTQQQTTSFLKGLQNASETLMSPLCCKVRRFNYLN